MAHKGRRKFQSVSALTHLAALSACSLAPTAAIAGDAPLPRKVGACATTTIASIGTRFGAGRPSNSEGTSFELKNMASGVSDGYVADIAESRVGDPVRTCVVSLPEGCPPNDDRGWVYKTTNLRTHRSWTLQDSNHSCGGA
jgi:hypothetical protein